MGIFAEVISNRAEFPGKAHLRKIDLVNAR